MTTTTTTTTATTEEWIDKKIDNDKYQLVEELGRGSYGCLFLGQCLLDKKYVAIKILSKKGLDSQQLLLQQLEIDIQKSLNHENILTLIHVIQEKDYIFIIMELCDGGDLFEFVVSNNNTLSTSMIKQLYTQILNAIEYLHKNQIFHRDIKLENILLQHMENDFISCKVADFGLATTRKFSLEFGCGSTTYLAPEHFGGEEEDVELPYDTAASDIWSLGILLLALLFGRNPWQEATLIDPSFSQFIIDTCFLKTELFPQLSNHCLNLLVKMLDINPTKRPDITQVVKEFKLIDELIVDYNQDVTIVVPSYDSAIFSQDDGCSLSDILVQEDDLIDNEYGDDDNDDNDDDDDDLFVHSQEKESWWL